MAANVVLGSASIELKADSQQLIKDLQTLDKLIKNGIIKSEEGFKQAIDQTIGSLGNQTGAVKKVSEEAGKIPDSIRKGSREINQILDTTLKQTIKELKQARLEIEKSTQPDKIGKLAKIDTSLKGMQQATQPRVREGFWGQKVKLFDEGAVKSEIANAQSLMKTIKPPDKTAWSGFINGTKEGNSAVGMLSGNLGKLGLVGGAVAGITLLVNELSKANEVAKQAATRISEISTLLSAPQRVELLEGIKADIGRISTETGKSFTDVSKATYEAISSGISAADASGVVEKASKAAVGGLAETKDVVDVLTSTINGLGLSAGDTDNILNNLFNIVKAGKATMPDLTASFGQIIPSARTSGLSLEQLSASITQLTLKGQPASRAVTNLSSLLQELSRPETVDKLKAIGVQGIDFVTGKIKDWQGFLQSLATKQLTPKQFGELIGSQEASRAIQSLITTNKAGVIELKDLFKDNFTPDALAGGYQQAHDIMIQSSENLAKKSEAAISNLQRVIGETTLPMTNTWNQFTANLAEKLSFAFASFEERSELSYRLGESFQSLADNSFKVGSAVVNQVAELNKLQEAYNTVQQRQQQGLATESQVIEAKTQLDNQTKLVNQSMEELKTKAPEISIAFEGMGLNAVALREKLTGVKDGFDEIAKLQFEKAGLESMQALEGNVIKLAESMRKAENARAALKEAMEKPVGEVGAAELIGLKLDVSKTTIDVKGLQSKINKEMKDAIQKGGLTKEEIQPMLDQAFAGVTAPSGINKVMSGLLGLAVPFPPAIIAGTIASATGILDVSTQTSDQMTNIAGKLGTDIQGNLDKNYDSYIKINAEKNLETQTNQLLIQNGIDINLNDEKQVQANTDKLNALILQNEQAIQGHETTIATINTEIEKLNVMIQQAAVAGQINASMGLQSVASAGNLIKQKAELEQLKAINGQIKGSVGKQKEGIKGVGEPKAFKGGKSIKDMVKEENKGSKDKEKEEKRRLKEIEKEKKRIANDEKKRLKEAESERNKQHKLELDRIKKEEEERKRVTEVRKKFTEAAQEELIQIELKGLDPFFLNLNKELSELFANKDLSQKEIALGQQVIEAKMISHLEDISKSNDKFFKDTLTEIGDQFKSVDPIAKFLQGIINKVGENQKKNKDSIDGLIKTSKSMIITAKASTDEMNKIADKLINANDTLASKIGFIEEGKKIDPEMVDILFSKATEFFKKGMLTNVGISGRLVNADESEFYKERIGKVILDTGTNLKKLVVDVVGSKVYLANVNELITGINKEMEVRNKSANENIEFTEIIKKGTNDWVKAFETIVDSEKFVKEYLKKGIFEGLKEKGIITEGADKKLSITPGKDKELEDYLKKYIKLPKMNMTKMLAKKVTTGAELEELPTQEEHKKRKERTKVVKEILAKEAVLRKAGYELILSYTKAFMNDELIEYEARRVSIIQKNKELIISTAEINKELDTVAGVTSAASLSLNGFNLNLEKIEQELQSLIDYDVITPQQFKEFLDINKKLVDIRLKEIDANKKLTDQRKELEIKKETSPFSILGIPNLGISKPLEPLINKIDEIKRKEIDKLEANNKLIINREREIENIREKNKDKAIKDWTEEDRTRQDELKAQAADLRENGKKIIRDTTFDVQAAWIQFVDEAIKITLDYTKKLGSDIGNLASFSFGDAKKGLKAVGGLAKTGGEIAEAFKVPLAKEIGALAETIINVIAESIVSETQNWELSGKMNQVASQNMAIFYKTMEDRLTTIQKLNADMYNTAREQLEYFRKEGDTRSEVFVNWQGGQLEITGLSDVALTDWANNMSSEVGDVEKTINNLGIELDKFGLDNQLWSFLAGGKENITDLDDQIARWKTINVINEGALSAVKQELDYRRKNIDISRAIKDEEIKEIELNYKLERQAMLLNGLKEDGVEIQKLDIEEIDRKIESLQAVLDSEKAISGSGLYSLEEEKGIQADINDLLIQKLKTQKASNQEMDGEYRGLLKQKQEIIKTMQLTGVTAVNAAKLKSVNEAITNRMQQLKLSRTTITAEKQQQLIVYGNLPKFQTGGIVYGNEGIVHRGEGVIQSKSMGKLGTQLFELINRNPETVKRIYDDFMTPITNTTTAGAITNNNKNIKNIIHYIQTIQTNNPMIAKTTTLKGFKDMFDSVSKENGLRAYTEVYR